MPFLIDALTLFFSDEIMPGKRYIIITADDFGFSKERNEGIIQAFLKGGVQSASILLNCSGTNDAAILAKQNGLVCGKCNKLSMPTNQ